MNPTQPCVESHAPKQAPKPPLYTGTVRKDDPELSVLHLTRYDSPRGSVKIESHAGLAPGMAEALAEVLAEATELTTELLTPELDTDDDELASKELLPDRVEDVVEDEAVAE